MDKENRQASFKERYTNGQQIEKLRNTTEIMSNIDKIKTNTVIYSGKVLGKLVPYSLLLVYILIQSYSRVI